MTNQTKASKFNAADIVTISTDYKNYATLDFAQPLINVYSVRAINNDGTIALVGVWPNIPVEYVKGVSVNSELVKQIYYNMNQTRLYVPGKVYQHEDIYSRPSFLTTMKERFSDTPMWEEMQKEEFHYVHEMQHWLIEHVGCSRICVNQFFGMRKPREI